MLPPCHSTQRSTITNAESRRERETMKLPGRCAYASHLNDSVGRRIVVLQDKN